MHRLVNTKKPSALSLVRTQFVDSYPGQAAQVRLQCLEVLVISAKLVKDPVLIAAGAKKITPVVNPHNTWFTPPSETTHIPD